MKEGFLRLSWPISRSVEALEALARRSELATSPCSDRMEKIGMKIRTKVKAGDTCSTDPMAARNRKFTNRLSPNLNLKGGSIQKVSSSDRLQPANRPAA